VARDPHRRRRRRDGTGRLLLLLGCSLLAFLGISGRLVSLQLVDASDLAAVAEKQRRFARELPADRGTIYDRDRRDLAVSVEARTVYAHPPKVADVDKLAAGLAPLLGMPERELLRLLMEPKPFVYLKRRISPEAWNRVRAKAAELGEATAIGADRDSRREYPGGSLAAQLLGFAGADGQGQAGLEVQYDSLLRGRPGRLLDERSADRPLPGGQRLLDPPVQGSDIVTTIDRSLQHRAEQVLAKAVKDAKARGGSIVVLAPGSGEVLAMANAPAFDAERRGDYASDDLNQRSKNRAVTDLYEPGSTNKVITAAAALEAGVVRPESVMHVPYTLPLCPNKTFRDSHYHAPEDITFAEVVAQSSNVGTIMVADRLGASRLAAAQKAFGYGEPPGVGFPAEQKGLLTGGSGEASKWRCSDLGTNAIGQSVAVTVLHMACVYATVANGGIWVQPTLVSKVIDPWGKEREVTQPKPPRRVISERSARALTSILTKVVEEGGTGTRAALPGYAIAGKTGTAQIPDQKGGYLSGTYVASFIGFIPADRPGSGVVIAVVLDHTTLYGGSAAAPAFKDLAQFAVTRLGLPPSLPPGKGATKEGRP
jgi:cell division protein FtsI (penicillin-binding protein 3)